MRSRWKETDSKMSSPSLEVTPSIWQRASSHTKPSPELSEVYNMPISSDFGHSSTLSGLEKPAAMPPLGMKTLRSCLASAMTLAGIFQMRFLGFLGLDPSQRAAGALIVRPWNATARQSQAFRVAL